jgi:hypothetical protein
VPRLTAGNRTPAHFASGSRAQCSRADTQTAAAVADEAFARRRLVRDVSTVREVAPMERLDRRLGTRLAASIGQPTEVVYAPADRLPRRRSIRNAPVLSSCCRAQRRVRRPFRCRPRSLCATAAWRSPPNVAAAPWHGIASGAPLNFRRWQTRGSRSRINDDC